MRSEDRKKHKQPKQVDAPSVKWGGQPARRRSKLRGKGKPWRPHRLWLLSVPRIIGV